MTKIEILQQVRIKAVESALKDALSVAPSSGELARPEKLLEAMQYSVLGGGKRLRPVLLIETASLFGVDETRSVRAGAALECIHCYSLVHDDLPSMDNDNLRRGKPTTHIAYDEATAILVGDGLLTLAFDLLSDPATHPDANVRIQLVQLYSKASGIGGMVGGQMLDLDAEGNQLDYAEIETLQAMKTGALIRCACEAGAIMGQANIEEREALQEFGTLIGRAFQLVDDILDVTSDSATLGKNTDKDSDRGKGTMVELLGVEATKQRAEELLDNALNLLSPFSGRAEPLAELARFVVERKL